MCLFSIFCCTWSGKLDYRSWPYWQYWLIAKLHFFFNFGLGKILVTTGFNRFGAFFGRTQRYWTSRSQTNSFIYRLVAPLLVLEYLDILIRKIKWTDRWWCNTVRKAQTHISNKIIGLGGDDNNRLSHPEVVDSLVGNLVLDPVQSGIVARAVLLLHEVRQVRHSGQLIQMRRGQVLRFQDHWDLEMLFSHLHGPLAIVRPVSRVEVSPVGHQPRLAIIDQGRQIDAIVPVRCEILDVAIFGQHSLEN